MKKRSTEKRIELPRRSQDIFPIDGIYKNGIFRYKNTFSRTWKFEDINYATLSDEQRKSILKRYSSLINSFTPGATVQLTIHNHRVDRAEFEQKLFIPMAGDGLDYYRQIYNQMFGEKLAAGNGMKSDKYITIAINKKNLEEADSYFSRASGTLHNQFNNLNTQIKELDGVSRVRMLHNIFRRDSGLNIDLELKHKKGEDIRDIFSPDYFKFKNESMDYFEFDNRFARVIYLREYGTYIPDEILLSLSDIPKDMIISITFTPVATEEAIDQLDKKIMNVDDKITKWQNSQNKNKNFSATVPHVMTVEKEWLEGMYDDMTKRDQRMFIGNVTLMHFADTLEELNADTENVMELIQGSKSEFGSLKMQQIEGLVNVLPLGNKALATDRTLLTENIAIMSPFKTQSVQDENGTIVGQNQINDEIVSVNRDYLKNGNQFILGVSGSGKSVKSKDQILQVALKNPNADVIIIDPDREYGLVTEAVNGTIIKISPTSDNSINAMDFNSLYDDKDPVAAKADFIQALFEQIMPDMTPQHRSIINRAAKEILTGYVNAGYVGPMPTLCDLYDAIVARLEEQAKEVALALEMYTSGTYNMFSRQTNVDIQSRIICYDINELKGPLMDVAMLTIMDAVVNRVTANRYSGRVTYLIVDELHLMFKHDFTATTLNSLWLRIRKCGGYCIGITQKTETLLISDEAKSMLDNSEFVIMLSQAEGDREALARLLHLDNTQLEYLTDANTGSGLVKVGKSIIPFYDKMPHNDIYRLVSTKPQENFL